MQPRGVAERSDGTGPALALSLAALEVACLAIEALRQRGYVGELPFAAQNAFGSVVAGSELSTAALCASRRVHHARKIPSSQGNQYVAVKMMEQ